MQHTYSFLFTLFFLLNASIASAQWHDAHWLMGSDDLDNAADSLYGTSVMRFDSLGGKYATYYDGDKTIDFWFSNASVSNALGNYLFSYNGYHIHDAANGLMLNGGNFNPMGFPDGGLLNQGGIILPSPSHSDKYILIHGSWEPTGGEVTVKYLYYSIIDMQKNMGLGEVVIKKKLITSGSMDTGKIVATRHANGRDWWVVVPEYDSNRYYSILITPTSFEVFNYTVGTIHQGGFGQAAFSPNGKYYAKCTAIDEVSGNYYDMYSFDRCTGTLSNHAQFHLGNGVIPCGVAFSPNDKYLYITYDRWVYQLDMESADIIASLKIVAYYDGYLSPQEGGWLVPTLFGDAHLAPDGKIYIALTYSDTREVHVIEYPDRLGVACQVKQHSVHFPTLIRTFPNFPNYRLGPLDGSPCDTLGMDNHPRANFRWEREDTLNPLRVTFTDLSFYAPDAWQWDFGDGTTSQEADPVHLYGSAGIYQVCLTVSNQYDSDTYCQTLYLGVSATGDPVPQNPIAVSPNPLHERLTVSVSTNLRNPVFRLYDMIGRVLTTQPIFTGLNEVDTATLPTGFYVWEVTVAGERMKTGKVVKMKE